MGQAEDFPATGDLGEARKRVLIVDDEQIIADTLVQILNLRGFTATAAYSGERAIEMAREMPPDVLLSDVVMQGMTGIEAAVQIRFIAPDCRMILFSGQPATAELLKVAESNGENFQILAKPVHPDVILEELRRVH